MWVCNEMNVCVEGIINFVVGVQIDKTYRVQCQIIQLFQMSMKLVYKVKKKFKCYLMQKQGKLKSVLKKTGM